MKLRLLVALAVTLLMCGDQSSLSSDMKDILKKIMSTENNICLGLINNSHHKGQEKLKMHFRVS